MEPSTYITRVFRYDTAALEFIFFAGVSSAICGLLYLVFRKNKNESDLALHYALYIALGFIAGATICFVLWLLIGGWGPPFPFIFALAGLGFGIYLGKTRWKSKV